MSFYLKKRSLIIYIALLIGCVGHVSGQCTFVSTQDSGCAPWPLNLTDTTVGSGSTATWTITLPASCAPNTVTFHGRYCSYILTCPGTYCVTMTDTVAGVACTSHSCNFTVFPDPIIAGQVSTKFTCVGNCVYWRDSSLAGFNSSPLTYAINWNNSQPIETVPGICETFPSTGSYPVVMVITNSHGCTAFKNVDTITVTAPPSATFTGSPLSSCTSPLVSTMTAPAPTTPNTKYLWYITTTGTFGSTPAQASGSNVFTYSYPAGTYSIKLVVIDTLSGCSDSTVQMSYVTAGSNQAACFTFPPADTLLCTGYGIVSFSPCTNGAIQYVWNFTGSPGVVCQPATQTLFTNATTPGYFSAGTAGVINIQLIVYYPGGCSDTANRQIKIDPPPNNIGFTSTDTSSCIIPASVCVTYTGSPCAGCTFSWTPLPNTPNPPNGHTGTCYQISSYGQYSPSLTITDTSGCSFHVTKNNYLSIEPIHACIQKQLSHGSQCANDTIIITNCTAGGPFSSIIWSFPGANVITEDSSHAVLTYGTTGCNKISMIVKSQAGCIDTLFDSICIAPKPNISMTVTPHDLCFEAMCNTFIVASITPGDTPTSVTIWPEGVYPPGKPSFIMNLTSGNPASDSFCYMYQDYGNFAFCFLANNRGCLGDTTCLTASADSVHIYPPIPSFTQVLSCTNTDSATFVNHSLDATSWYWTFNGVNYPNFPTITVPFPQCGAKYPISLTVTNDTTHCTLTKFDSTAIVPCYGADFVVSKTKGCYPDLSNDSAHIVLSGPNVLAPTTINWSITPTGYPISFAQSGPQIGFGLDYQIYNIGLYNVCTQLTYPNGCVDTICKNKYIDISNPAPGFTVSSSEGCVPLCVQFTNTSHVYYGVQAHFLWNFGDNSPTSLDSVNLNPNHCFDSTGQFQTCLTVIDTNGCSAKYCFQIQANQIHANFSETDSVTCPANASPLSPITYTNTSTGFVSNFSWLLPSSLGPIPPSQGNSASITEQYSSLGYDSIGLIAIDQFGTCRDTVWKQVHVVNPVADYGIANPGDTTWICPPASVCFFDSSRFDVCQYAWNFGDGSPIDTQQNACHIWTTPGRYCVTEIVTSCHGCVDTITKYCINIGGPYVNMTCNSKGGCPCLPVTFVIGSYHAQVLQVTSGGGNPAFTTVNVSPVGTPGNLSYDTVVFTYCNVEDIRPSVRAFDSSANCWVFYDSLIVPIPVDTPQVNFSANVRYCGSDSVCFTNLTSFAASYAHDSTDLWSFGDGTTSTSHNPCHQYPTPGSYKVSLLVSDNVGCFDSLSKNVYIPKPPVAILSVGDTIGCAPYLVHFRDSSTADPTTGISSGHWNFGNGVSSATFNDTFYNYTSTGSYTATLVVTDGYGCTDSTHQSIDVLSPPSISVSPNVTICLGDTTTLRGSGSDTLLWLTNYNIDSVSSPTPRVWPTVTTQYVLSVGSASKCFVYDTVTVFVSTINITLDTATDLCANELTVFTATALTTNATITGYNWSFGDGTGSANAQTGTHQYATFGTYSDTLIVTNSIGCKDTAVRQVNIVDIPHAALSISVDSVCLGAPVTVTNLSTAGASIGLSSFYFDLKDGLPNDTTSPFTFTYPSAGSFDILLVQKDSNQCLDSAQRVFVVHSLPRLGLDNSSACINVDNDYVSIDTLGDGPISMYNWTINGVSQGVDSNHIHRAFPDTGLYTFCLNVSDVYGCKDTACQDIRIFSNPLDTVSPLDTTICIGYSASFKVTGPRFDRVQWVPSTWVNNPTADSVVITPRQTISYQVYSYYQECVPKIDTVNIWVIDTVPVSAIADPYNIVLGLSSNVTSVVQGTIDSIVWAPDSTLSCRNCRNPIATPHETTTYTATVYYTKNGVTCSNTAKVTITVYQSCNDNLIYVPNTFTPNSDGKNDAFRIRGMGISKVNYFRIYDRWGKLVYQAENVTDTDDAAWNGCLNNDQSKPETSGVFVYVFDIQCITGQSVVGKGNVTLIR